MRIEAEPAPKGDGVGSYITDVGREEKVLGAWVNVVRSPGSAKVLSIDVCDPRG